MQSRSISLAVLAVLVACALLVGAPATVAANGDHDHGDDTDGGLPDWVPDVVSDLVRAIGGLFGATSDAGGVAAWGVDAG